MAADRNETPGARGGTVLLLALAAVTGYVAWRVAPLENRMDALERRRLEAEDRLLAETEKLERELSAIRESQVPPSRVAPAAGRPTEERAAENAPTPPSPPPPTSRIAPPRVRTGADFLDSHLFPADASLAQLMLKGRPVGEIARLVGHSVPFVVARGVQIEKQLAAMPETPPDVIEAIRKYLERAREASSAIP